jgi:hypothetical protein
VLALRQRISATFSVDRAHADSHWRKAVSVHPLHQCIFNPRALDYSRDASRGGKALLVPEPSLRTSDGDRLRDEKSPEDLPEVVTRSTSIPSHPSACERTSYKSPPDTAAPHRLCVDTRGFGHRHCFFFIVARYGTLRQTCITTSRPIIPTVIGSHCNHSILRTSLLA